MEKEDWRMSGPAPPFISCPTWLHFVNMATFCLPRCDLVVVVPMEETERLDAPDRQRDACTGDGLLPIFLVNIQYSISSRFPSVWWQLPFHCLPALAISIQTPSLLPALPNIARQPWSTP